MTVKTILLTLTAFILIGTGPLLSQKFGHINTGNLLELLPEVKSADAELVTLRDKLMSERDQKMKSFQTKYEEIVRQANNGLLTPKQQQEKELEIQKDQQQLQQFEQSIQSQIAKKREDLLGPILQKVDNAIQAVGKEGGYTMVFDSSSGGLLFAEDSEDLMPKVKKKLGL